MKRRFVPTTMGIAFLLAGLCFSQDPIPISRDPGPQDTPSTHNFKICPQCDTRNPPEARFCLSCGARLPGAEPETTVEDPNYSRLFVVPTAQPLKKGAGYAGDAMLFFLQGAVGASDNVTLFGASTLFPGNLDWQIIAGGPKVLLYQRGPLWIAAGGLAAFGAHLGSTPWALYGVATLGRTTGRLNLAVGKLGAGTGPTTPWLFSIGGEAGRGRRMRVLWESWIWRYDSFPDRYIYYPEGPPGKVTETAFPTCVGFRFFGETMSMDLGLLYPFTTEEGGWSYPIGIPIVAAQYHFK